MFINKSVGTASLRKSEGYRYKQLQFLGTVHTRRYSYQRHFFFVTYDDETLIRKYLHLRLSRLSYSPPRQYLEVIWWREETTTATGLGNTRFVLVMCICITLGYTNNLPTYLLDIQNLPRQLTWPIKHKRRFFRTVLE